MAFNTDKQTGKKMGRSLMANGDTMPTQFNSRSVVNGSVGNSVSLGSIIGGGMGPANNMAGRAVSPMPNIPKGSIFGQ